MQDYPVFHPEKYSGVQLILSNPTTQTYNTGSNYKNSYQSNYITSKIYDNAVNTSAVRQRNYIAPIVTTPPPSKYHAEQRIKKQAIKGESRIQYVPVQKRVTDYVDQPRYSIVPKKRIITDYKDIVKIDVVPREVISTDYYAIQHIRSYVPQIIPQQYVEYVPIQRKNIKYQYIPVQRQILHCPQKIHQQEQSRYLGVRQVRGNKTYENLRESDIVYWEKQYGYIRGQPISVLNQKIRNKIEREKQQFFKQFQSRSTLENSQYNPNQNYI